MPKEEDVIPLKVTDTKSLCTIARGVILEAVAWDENIVASIIADCFELSFPKNFHGVDGLLNEKALALKSILLRKIDLSDMIDMLGDCIQVADVEVYENNHELIKRIQKELHASRMFRNLLAHCPSYPAQDQSISSDHKFTVTEYKKGAVIKHDITEKMLEDEYDRANMASHLLFQLWFLLKKRPDDARTHALLSTVPFDWIRNILTPKQRRVNASIVSGTEPFNYLRNGVMRNLETINNLLAAIIADCSEPTDKDNIGLDIPLTEKGAAIKIDILNRFSFLKKIALLDESLQTANKAAYKMNQNLVKRVIQDLNLLLQFHDSIATISSDKIVIYKDYERELDRFTRIWASLLQLWHLIKNRPKEAEKYGKISTITIAKLEEWMSKEETSSKHDT